MVCISFLIYFLIWRKLFFKIYHYFVFYSSVVICSHGQTQYKMCTIGSKFHLPLTPELFKTNKYIPDFRYMCCVLSCSVMSNSLQPHELYLAHQALLSMGILQARILEWVAMPSSRGSFQPRVQTEVSHTAGRFLPSEPPGKSLCTEVGSLSLLRGSSWPRNQTGVSFSGWATRVVVIFLYKLITFVKIL